MVTFDTLIIAGSIAIATLVLGAFSVRTMQRETAQMETLGARLQAAFAENTEQIEESINETTREQLEALSDSQTELTKLGDRIDETSDELEAAVAGFSAAVGTVEDFEGLRQWGETLEDAAEPVERIADDVESWHHEQQALLEETTDALSDYAAQRTHIEEDYRKAMDVLEEWQTEHTLTQQENAEALKSQLEQLSAHSEAMRRTVEQFGDEMERQSTVRNELVDTLPGTLAKLDAVSEELNELSAQTNTNAQRFEEIAEPMAAAAETFEENSNETLELVREQAAENEATLEATAEMLTESNSELLDGVTALSDELEELRTTQTPPWVEYTKVLLLTGILGGICAIVLL